MEIAFKDEIRWLTKKNYKIAKYESTKYDNKVDFFFARFSTKVAKIK
jgi:hypothetical protein